ncbi:acetolactate synthase [Methanocella sp. CWC-04]|uniref:Acetolactate synthase n=1 Tax=Methanooceanicella nereidis TaxID=2052831 RepID=A0AAP2W6S0_9EURY|nr:ACT domain-containing protein [Methanocella sp. CWC-04]MCD1295633.1 acetolactate synthase [Methanocella sp. CWC-04]
MKGTIKQISLFAENKPGRLAKIAEVLSKAKINIRAFNIAEAGDFGVIRMVVDDADKAFRALQSEGFAVSETEVIGVQMKDIPGSLYEIAKSLGENNVNIDYAYAFITKTEMALLILRVDDIPGAQKVLNNIKVRLVDSSEISSL